MTLTLLLNNMQNLLFGIAGFLVGAVIMAGWVAGRPEPEIVQKQPKWCHYATYDSMVNYSQTRRPANVRIETNGRQVIVHVRCEDLSAGTLY